MPSALHKSETYATVVASLHILFSQIQTFFALERYIISCLTGFLFLSRQLYSDAYEYERFTTLRLWHCSMMKLYLS